MARLFSFGPVHSPHYYSISVRQSQLKEQKFTGTEMCGRKQIESSQGNGGGGGGWFIPTTCGYLLMRSSALLAGTSHLINIDKWLETES